MECQQAALPSARDRIMSESEYIPREAGEGEGPRQLVRSDEILPETLPCIPLNAGPFFPVQVQPVVLSRDPWGSSIETLAESSHQLLAFSWVPDNEGTRVPRPGQFSEVGTAVRVHRLQEADGRFQFIAKGLERIRIIQWLRREPPYLVRVQYLKVQSGKTDQLRAYAMSLINSIKELMRLNPVYNEELRQHLSHFDASEPGPLADFAAAITSAAPESKQEILETLPLQERMDRVLPLLARELELARLQAKISEQMQEQVSGRQREFFLRQQLKAIQKELGIAKDDRQADAERFAERMARFNPPPPVEARMQEEMRKLEVLETASAEYGVTRNYLEWITSLPWGHFSEDRLDLAHARQVLDRDHYGLDDVKERIIEFLALGAFRGEISGSILLFVGPPGVGKTSIGQSIARALGRKFFRFSLGGMRDEAEIKGHRRTYVGAMPGKFVQALKDVEVSNPVIMLDEVDKTGASYQGDPASALLEVLDPEQNSDFLDHYLDLRVDLSKVLFVCTANQTDTIPPALLDRMELIRLSGYITEEKRQIARRHLWKRQLKRARVRAGQLQISDAALRHLIENYAREAGVRNLDLQLGRILRKNVVSLLENPEQKIRVGIKQVEDCLGEPFFRPDKKASAVGTVNGLAYTAAGGSLLQVEAARVHGLKRDLILTGQMGTVMTESAEIACSYISSHLAEYGAEAGLFDRSVIHLHVPEGATPKDGPSAGITMATAILSLARQQKPLAALAMTGELTLTGKVLPVGGIRDKVIAARRAGISRLILPSANQRDFSQLPEYLQQGLDIIWADHFRQVAEAALPPAAP